MIKTVVIDGKKISFKQSDVLGVGGEATVVKAGKFAVKIFHKPSRSRAAKLLDFLQLKKLPSTICAPLKLCYSTRKEVVGFVMQQLSPQYEALQMLGSKKYRKQHPSLTLATITDILLSGYDTIEQLHPKGIIIGDNNDLNALFWKTRMVYIDADSFQFGNHPCQVGTDNFLAPELYDTPLAQKPYFKPLHDWYSWFVMYFRSLLMVHPYGGVHKEFKTVPQRAQSKITCFDSSVIYPKSGLHPDLLSQNLKSMFERQFHKGKPTGSRPDQGRS